MKRKILKTSLKNILVSFLIAIILLPLISVNVIGSSNIKTIKADKVYKLTLDGKKPENVKIVKYTEQIRDKSLVKTLGSFNLETVYNNKTHINSGYQDSLDICWTFGNKNLVESFLSKKNNIKLELSSRHMDYALSDVVLGSLNRTPGSGAAPLLTLPYFSTNQGPVKEENFPFHSTITTPSLDDLNKNIEDIYLEGHREFPSIFKELEEDEIKYSLFILGNFITDVPESLIFEIRNEMKQHIKEFGAISAATISNNPKVYYPAEEFIYNSSDEIGEISHNISIIGWDDNFCANNPDGALPGELPKNDGAWLVSDSNQPYGNQFYYIAYDDAFIENVLIGINDVSIGKRFNVYRHDLIGKNAIAVYEPKNDVGDPELAFANIYEKIGSDVEYLNKISFLTVGEVSVDAYYIKTEDISSINLEQEGIKIGSVTINDPGIMYYTMDIEEPIELSEGEFVIYLNIINHSGLGKTERSALIPVEILDEDPLYSNIVMKENSYIINDEVGLSEYNFPIRAYTSNQIVEDDMFFIVLYDLQGGEGEFPMVSIAEGSYVENSQIPTKEGYKFIGWTPNPETTPIIEDTTFTANWEKLSETELDPDPEPSDTKPENTATFLFGDGIIQYIEIGSDGYVINIPSPEARSGYKFIGWNPDPKRTKANENTIFYGLWERLGSSDSGHTTIDYTQGSINDGTQAPIRIPDAGKSITIILIIMLNVVIGVIFFVKYKKIDK